jgi:hypothetical protein
MTEVPPLTSEDIIDQSAGCSKRRSRRMRDAPGVAWSLSGPRARRSGQSVGRAGADAAKIVQGRKARRPANRASQQVLVVNLKTAKQLGIAVPPNVLPAFRGKAENICAARAFRLVARLCENARDRKVAQNGLLKFLLPTGGASAAGFYIVEIRRKFYSRVERQSFHILASRPAPRAGTVLIAAIWRLVPMFTLDGDRSPSGGAFAGPPPAVAHRQHFREKHTTCPFTPLRGHCLVRTMSCVRMLGCAIRFRCSLWRLG